MNTFARIVPEAGTFIDGLWQPPEGGGKLAVVSPSDGSVFTDVAAGDAADVHKAVKSARAAVEGGAWSQLARKERGDLLVRLGKKIAQRAAELAWTEARDTGKPISHAKSEIMAAARWFEACGAAASAPTDNETTVIPPSGNGAQTARQPYGVTAHIASCIAQAHMMGWTIGPALGAGNAVIVKPAEEACLTPLAIAGLAAEAGFPRGAINVVPGIGREAGVALAGHPGIDFLSFAGSPQVGAHVEALAARHKTPFAPRISGTSPQIVFADADIDTAAAAIASAAIKNAGQSRAAASQVLVAIEVWDAVVAQLQERFSSFVAGPHDEDCDLGSLISANQKARVEGVLARAGGPDAPVLARGKVSARAARSGYFVAPTLFGPVAPSHPLAREDVFGPLLACVPFVDEDGAVMLANATSLRSTAGLWTRNGALQRRVANRLRCQAVLINGVGAGAPEPALDDAWPNDFGQESVGAMLQQHLRGNTAMPHRR